ncbi:Na/Pi cotransporter family protein [Paenibacillus sp. Dod16]|uniref:Na/Pi cotransporter family protein n=1 Tax=Paenibacillus sp. Dod16 TaxID=3416392 RepID=UPI003CEB85ED
MLSSLWFPICYGLVLFLFGMKVMEVALQRWAGPLLHKWLHKATSTPLKGMIASTAVTALLQKSNAANVLISLQIGQAAMPLLVLSLMLWVGAVLVSERAPSSYDKLKNNLIRSQFLCLAVAGFSLVLLAIQFMQSIGPTLQSLGVFQWFLDHASRSVLWGIAAGTILTALMHSSAAVIAMAMGLAASGALPPEIGVAIVLGSNVGTCATALIAAIGSTRAGRFVAWSHMGLNIGGVLLFTPFISGLTAVSGWLAADPAGQIAHAQTLFNIVCSLIALPLCYLPFWNKRGQT